MPQISKLQFEQAVIKRSHHTNHYISLLDDLSYFQTTQKWCFAYKIALGTVFLCADPITSVGPSFFELPPTHAAKELGVALREFAEAMNLRPIVLVGMSEAMSRVAREVTDLRLAKVGEEPWLTLENYEPRGHTAKGVRAGRNQAQRAGCIVEEVDLIGTSQNAKAHETIKQIEALVASWKATTTFHAEGLFMYTDPFAPLPGRRAFICRRDGAVEVLLIATPIVAGRSYYLEDVITAPGFTNGAVELSILTAMKALEQSGVVEVSLGVVALRGTRLFRQQRNALTGYLKRSVRFVINRFYNMEGIDFSRRRFKPHRWEATYLATYSPKQRRIPRALMLLFFTLAFLVALEPRLQPKLSTRRRAAISAASLLLLGFLFWALPARAKIPVVRPPEPPNYHLVGALNTIIPGAGAWLNGDYVEAGGQALAEVSTFSAGYRLSPLKPMTLDGAPEQIPLYTRRGRRRGDFVNREIDIRPELWADWLQEIGIKYHMLNVFDEYREAARKADAETLIDQSSIAELFLTPFLPKTWADPLTAAAIVLSAGVVYWDYNQNLNQLARTRAFTGASDDLYGATYIGMYPFGSAVPEEAFFRGYLQNELYALIPSPYFAIPVSTALFALSHAPEARPTAFAGGLLFGFLTYVSDNQLERSIATHYWIDVFGGIEAYLLYNKAQVAVRVRRPRPRTNLRAPHFELINFSTSV